MKYKITEIRQRSIEVDGARELVMRIFYTTERGYKGSVDVAKEKFSDKEARKRIEKEIKEMVKLEKEKEVTV